jgi:hypothetical protein
MPASLKCDVGTFVHDAISDVHLGTILVGLQFLADSLPINFGRHFGHLWSRMPFGLNPVQAYLKWDLVGS